MSFNTGLLSSACFMNIVLFARYKYHLLLSYAINDFYLYPNMSLTDYEYISVLKFSRPRKLPQ